MNMVFLEEVVECQLATQVVGEAILELGSHTEVLDFSAIVQVETYAFHAFLGIGGNTAKQCYTNDH